MNIVIPLSPFNNTNNAELKYALRGFEKYLPHDGVTIIGRELPDWIQDVELITFADTPDERFRDRNIMLKLSEFIKKHEREYFIYANDDHFLLKEWDSRFFHKGPLKEALVGKSGNDPYRKTIQNTIDWLGATDYNYNFDIHYPMHTDPDRFKVFMPKPNWNKPFGYLLKTVYCYGHTSYPELQIEDFKINEPSTFEKIKESLIGKSFFSTSDKAFNAEMQKVLEYLYPVKSKYER